MFILASFSITASRGYPEEFEPFALVADGGDLVRFCEKYGIEIGGGPKWYLCSYWG